MKKKKIGFYVKRTILGFLCLELVFLLIGLFIHLDKGSINSSLAIPSDFTLLKSDTLNSFTAKPREFLPSGNLVDDGIYGDLVYDFSNEKISFSVEVDSAGDYIMYVDYLSNNNTIEENIIDLIVNGEEFDLFNNIELNTLWENETEEELFDIYNNEVASIKKNASKWVTTPLYDQQFLSRYPLLLELKEGMNKIEIEKNSGNFLLGNINFVKFDGKYQEYEEYQEENNILKENNKLENELFVIEGEDMMFSSDPTIGSSSINETHMTPFSTKRNYLNSLTGDSFNQSGYYVVYGFNIENAGIYEISLKYYISQSNSNTYTKILIDNEIPFEDLNCYVFKANKNYKNTTLSNENGDFKFYFEKGFHTISIMLDASNQKPIYDEIMKMTSEINDLYLEVIKLTNGNVDKNKEWDIDNYIPTARTRLNDFLTRLENLLEIIENVSKSNKSKTNRLYQQIDNAYKKMKKLVKDPNKLPQQLDILSEGNSSVSKMLSNSIHTSTFSPLSIDKIYIHSEDVKIPKANSNLFVNQIATVQRIVKSGVNIKDDENTIHIWVNRSTYYVSLMQQFADAYYTPITKQKIRFSLLPDENKIIYANASNTIPDAAFGVSSSIPYDLGLRGALVNLRDLEGFNQLISNFTPGSLLNKIVEDRVYGIPETQDFQVTFYRTDLTRDLGVDIPNTWEELINVLPELQRYGMNYYIPMASGSGLKGISVTAPFIYQYGGNIYSEDYMSSQIDSKEAIEAMNLMADLFTIYSLPITAQNFYQSFRDGTIPMGVAGFDTYLQISQAAPEIQGKWDITLSPGVLREDGTINRTSTGAGRDIVIFNKSKKVNEAWDFISWWMDTDIQTSFANTITQTYGATYLWNTANINAFKNLPISDSHKEVILKQWEELITIPQIPATYIIERGISDIWNQVVFEQKPIRSSISDMMAEMDNEIKRKMQEFGYMNNKGEVVKNYFVATIEDIKSWIEVK